MMSSTLTARVVLMLVCVLALVMVADVAWAATHHRTAPQSIDIGCAMVLTRESGPECR